MLTPSRERLGRGCPTSRQGIVIQARLGSTRLPGKVLARVGEHTVLELCARRAVRAREAAVVVVATTSAPRDDAVAAEAARLGLPCVRGSEDDVLARYGLAAEAHALDVVGRITSDCPFIDPDTIDAIFRLRARRGADYASNTLTRTFPRGLDVEVFRREALDRACREARDPAEREHVTPYLYRHPEVFSLACLESPVDLSAHRWTVDEPDDLRLVREIVRCLPGDPVSCSLAEFLGVLGAHPELARINAGVEQKKL